MSDLGTRAARRTAIPFDLAATLADTGWRERLGWPLAPAEMRRAVAGPMHRLFRYLPALAPAERDAVLLALPRFAAAARYGIEVALTLQAADRAGIALRIEDATARHLQGDTAATPAFARGVGGHVAVPRHAALRRLARTASWTPPWRLPAALLAPEAIAISHNGLLLGEARRRGAPVSFHQGEAILTAARRLGAALDGIPDAAPIVDLLCDEPALDGPYTPALRGLVAGAVETALAEAAAELAGLARLRRLPREIWSGTGGQWASRAVGLAVLARGGRAIRFDHGGTSVMARDPTHLALVEMAVSSAVTLPTEAAVRQVTGGAVADLPPLRDCALAGAGGDAHFRAVPRASMPGRISGTAKRPRVVYAPTILRGARQFHNGLLPDPVYLDWQLRVAERLRDEPIDLLCKPHPEGLLRGQPHPLGAVAPTSERRFEAEMADADVFVIDHAESTTFWTALCSDKPVVLLDLGTWSVAPEVEAALARRAHVLPIAYDDRHLPVIPPDLPDVLREIAGRPYDPDFFRALLAGD